jgi:hypothetical protein
MENSKLEMNNIIHRPNAFHFIFLYLFLNRLPLARGRRRKKLIKIKEEDF